MQVPITTLFASPVRRDSARSLVVAALGKRAMESPAAGDACVGTTTESSAFRRPTFLLFGPFCERSSQLDPCRKEFGKWTLSSAPWLAAPR
jgi:hypothetical protein